MNRTLNVNVIRYEVLGAEEEIKRSNERGRKERVERPDSRQVVQSSSLPDPPETHLEGFRTIKRCDY